MAAKKKVTTSKAPAKKAPAKKVPAQKAPATKSAPKAPSAKAVKKAPAKPAEKKAPVVKAAGKVPAKKAPAVEKPAAAKKAPAPVAVPKKAAPVEAPAAKAVSTVPAGKKVHKRKKALVAELNGQALPKHSPVKPVIPAKPVKLTQFVIKQRQNLLDLRDELMDAMYGVQQEALRNGPQGSEASGSGMHQGDAGSDAYDRDFALNLLSKEQDALAEIEGALKRVEAGTYGICEMSGKKIPQARLEAIPFARLTVECQTIWEKEFPNRTFRSSDSIGYGEEARSGGSLVSLDAGD